MDAARRQGRRRLLFGLGMVLLFWALNWGLPGYRTAYLFFPLWLGYALAVDGAVQVRRGASILSRSPLMFVLHFVLSAPVWWLFEVINWRTKNWEYLGGEHFSSLEYFLLSTLSFSTVMPAVFGTAELVRSFSWVEQFGEMRRRRVTRRGELGCLLSGVAMAALSLAWPTYFYPFVWTSVVLILEPVNRWLGRRSLLDFVEGGDLRPVWSLAAGALVCGFFWELWNFHSFPKWQYHTPGTEFLYVFEMPLLGYFGYLPFALELYAMRNFLWPGAPELLVKREDAVTTFHPQSAT